MIYFAHNKARNAVKIGFSENLEARFKVLQTASLDPLELIGTIEGDRTAEKELHRKFKQFRINGEWFLVGPELDEFIKEMVVPLKVNGIEIKSFYLAGRLSNPNWRSKIIGNWESACSSNYKDGSCDHWTDKEMSFPVTRGSRKHYINYNGPFFAEITSGITINENYGSNGHGGYNLLSDNELVSTSCRNAIEKSDLFFAWVDSRDCFGTLVEIGYAAARKDKVIVIATSVFDDELWFAYSMANILLFESNPSSAWENLWIHASQERESSMAIFSSMGFENED